MGLMDDFKNMEDMKNNAANGEGVSHEGLTQAVMSSFQGQGGLSGLVSAFHEHGLGGVISSWVSNGPNQEVGGNQIAQVLGGDRISAIASKFGLPATAVTETLARLLPGMIDKMTPNGKLPQNARDEAA